MKFYVAHLPVIVAVSFGNLFPSVTWGQRPATAPIAAFDSDGDGEDDTTDSHPFVADLPKLRWTVGPIAVGWRFDGAIDTVQTKLQEDETRMLKSAKVDFGKSLSADAGLNANAKASITLNPFALVSSGLDVAAELGASASLSKSWDEIDQEHASSLRRVIGRQEVASHLTDLHLEFTVSFINEDDVDYIGTNLVLPVMDPNGNAVVYAQPWGPQGAEEQFRIPKGRNQMIPIRFRASLDTTQSLKLLDILQSQPLGIDVGKTQGSIGSVDLSYGGQVDAISQVASIDRSTIPFEVELDGTVFSWRVARFKGAARKPLQLGEVLDAINKKAAEDGSLLDSSATMKIFDRTDFYLRSAMGMDNSISPAKWWVIDGPDGQPKDVNPNEPVKSPVRLRFQHGFPRDMKRWTEPVEARDDKWRMKVTAVLLTWGMGGLNRDVSKGEDHWRKAREPSDPKDVPGGLYENCLGMKFVPISVSDRVIQMSVYETRVQDYAAFAKENPQIDMSWKGAEFNGHKQAADHPVVMVSCEDARLFCKWLSRKEGRLYRLPTEMEWSFAANDDSNLSVKVSKIVQKAKTLQSLLIPHAEDDKRITDLVQAIEKLQGELSSEEFQRNVETRAQNRGSLEYMEVDLVLSNMEYWIDTIWLGAPLSEETKEVLINSAGRFDEEWDIYPWGNDWPPPKGAGNFSGTESAHSWRIEGYTDQHPFTAPVGAYKANLNSLYDLEGNVSEWCESPANIDALCRGGNWHYHHPDTLRWSEARNGFEFSFRDSGLGFRVVADLGEP